MAAKLLLIHPTLKSTHALTPWIHPLASKVRKRPVPKSLRTNASGRASQVETKTWSPFKELEPLILR